MRGEANKRKKKKKEERKNEETANENSVVDEQISTDRPTRVDSKGTRCWINSVNRSRIVSFYPIFLARFFVPDFIGMFELTPDEEQGFVRSCRSVRPNFSPPSFLRSVFVFSFVSLAFAFEQEGTLAMGSSQPQNQAEHSPRIEPFTSIALLSYLDFSALRDSTTRDPFKTLAITIRVFRAQATRHSLLRVVEFLEGLLDSIGNPRHSGATWASLD